MDLILGTLSELKAHLLNGALQADTSYDGAIAALGKGVAERMQRQCNRQFARVVGATHEFDAACDHVLLPRYPVEAITKVDLRESLAAGWIDQGAVNLTVENLRESSGLVEFFSALGAYGTRVRLTYTGGYWIDLSGDGSIAGARSYQDGNAALSINAESLAVVFPTAFAAAPKVTVTIVPPGGGTIILAVPSVITAAGFTALLGFPVPATGYTLQWTAAAEGAPTVPESSQPAGSTARPADLYYAWLLQCERTWSVRDKLGVSIGQPTAPAQGQSLAALELVPEVKEVLRNYTRYAIT
jgi:hypothetical protein